MRMVILLSGNIFGYCTYNKTRKLFLKMKKHIISFCLMILVCSCNKTNKSSKDLEEINSPPQISADSLKKYPTYGFIERFDSAIDSLISKEVRIELVAQGFNWSEGPVWLANEQKLLFSDVPENKIYQWNDLNGLSLYMMPSGYTGTTRKNKGSNGLTLDVDGNLIICQEGDRVISKLVSLRDSLHPKFEPFITNYKGKKFNSPNDLVYDKNDNLYFTDPSFGLGNELSEIGFNGVYFYSKNDELFLIDDSITAPNGIAVSPNGKTLYVADSHMEHPSVWAYDIVSDGIVKNKRKFFDATEALERSIDKQKCDGFKLDKQGNMFLAGPGGVLIVSPEGKHLGTIRLDKPTGNCEFTDDGRFLFITCDDYLLRVNLKPDIK